MSAATGPERSQQESPGVTEAEAREYLKQLRAAPAEQIVQEVLFTVLNAAQVKLGRRDARLFIDLAGVTVEQVRGHVSEELTKQVDQALAQLRLGQVDAERSVAEEPNDLDRTPTAPSARPAADAPQPPSSASKLWVPGR